MSNVANLNARFSATIIDFQREVQRMQRMNATAMARIQQQHQQSANGVNRAWRQAGLTNALQSQISSVSSLSSALRDVAPALAAAFSVTEAARAADTYTRFTNSLKVAGLQGGALAEVQDRLYAAAQQNGQALEPLGQLYGRAAQSAKELGASQEQLLKFTGAVAAAIRVQGGDAASAQGAILQLSQALAAGTVRAEEFNSINEGALPLLQAAAGASDKYGGSVAKLRAEVLAGKLSSKDFFDLILKGSADLEAKAANAPLTIAASFQQLQNALVKYIGEADQALGVSERLTAAIKMLADNLGPLLTAIGAVSAVLLGRMVASLAIAGTTAAATAASNVLLAAALTGMTAPALAASVAMRALSVSMAFFGGPIGLAITAVAAAISFFAVKSAFAKDETKSLADVIRDSDAVLSKYGDSADEASKGTTQFTKNVDYAKGRADALAGRLTNLAEKYRQVAQAARLAAIWDVQNKMIAIESKATAEKAGNSRGMASLGAMGIGPGMPGYAELKAEQANSNTAIDRQAAARLAELKVLESKLKATDWQDERWGASVLGTSGGGAGAKPKGGGGRSSPTAAEIAARRELLDLENKMMVARERGDLLEIEALENKLALHRAIADFRNAGYADAEKRGQDLMRQVLEARAYVRSTTVEEKDRLKPFPTDGAFISTTDATASIKEGLEASAAEIRENFRDSIRGGLEAAIQGSWPGLVEYMGQALQRRLLDNLSNMIADSVMGSGSGTAGGIAAFIPKLFGFASGTNYAPGGLSVVGEKGPELVNLPRGAQVVPNNLLKTAFSQPGGSGSGVAQYNLTTVVNANDAVLTGWVQQQVASSHIMAVQSAMRMTQQEMAKRGRNRLS